MVISQLEITMDSIRSLHPMARAWLLDRPAVSAHVDAFQALLERGRYAEGGLDKGLRALAHFAHWMTRCRLSAEQIDEALVEEFLDSHLPRCDCHTAASRTHGDLRANLAHLLTSLRERRVISSPRAQWPHCPGAVALQRAHARRPWPGDRHAGAAAVDGEPAAAVRIRPQGHRHRRVAARRRSRLHRNGADAEEQRVAHASALAAALRAYFRYRATCGDSLHALLGVISSPARWSLASLPRALTTEEVQRLLAHCAQARPTPLRVLAMVRLALDLGLRVGEIARLELADFDWRAGTVTLKGTKSRRQDVLPLPAATGQALAEYLRHERPASTLPTLFVRRVAPHDKPMA